MLNLVNLPEPRDIVAKPESVIRDLLTFRARGVLAATDSDTLNVLSVALRAIRARRKLDVAESNAALMVSHGRLDAACGALSPIYGARR